MAQRHVAMSPRAVWLSGVQKAPLIGINGRRHVLHRGAVPSNALGTQGGERAPLVDGTARSSLQPPQTCLYQAIDVRETCWV